MSITRTNFERQYQHQAVIAHGAHPEYRLEFDATVAATGGAGIYQGSIVSLDTAGEYVLGCSAGTGINYPVPCISMKNVAGASDPDVVAGVQGPTQNVTYVTGTGTDTVTNTATFADYKLTTYSAIGGKITAIPLTGSYEIETTEYNASATYAVNDAVVVGTSGQVTVASTALNSGAEVCVGFVSRIPAAKADQYGTKKLSFFANFIPAAH